MPKRKAKERGRAFRRHQNDRIIQKRLNILKKCWGYDKVSYGTLREQKCPGFLRKWNFTCNCGMCKMERYFARRDKHKRENMRGYSEEEYCI